MKTHNRMRELQKLLTEKENQEIEYCEHIRADSLELGITMWDRGHGQRLTTRKIISFVQIDNSVEDPQRFIDFTFRAMCEEVKAAVAKWYN